MVSDPTAPRVTILGAGAIGAFAGGMLARAGLDVDFIGRGAALADLRERGLRLTDYAGLDHRIEAADLRLTERAPDALRGASLVLVCVKSAATQAAVAEIAAHAPRNAVIVSLQNGLDGFRTLRAGLPDQPVIAGMVPFNVVSRGPGLWHRATSGEIQIGPDAAARTAVLDVPGLGVRHTPQIDAIRRGKLLINLNNALNALSGLPLLEQLMDRDWRRLMADQIAEALNVFHAHDLTVRGTTALPVAAIPFVLRLPTPLFRRIAAQMLTVDPAARSSMAQDLSAGKPTEIDALQGEIIALGAEKAIPTPLSLAIRDAVKRAEAGMEYANGPDGLRP